jgi:hypothetical protein
MRQLRLSVAFLLSLVPSTALAQDPKATPSFRLDSLRAIAVRPGNSQKVPVALNRDGHDKPITLTAANLPEGVTIETVTVPKGSEEATLIVVVAENAQPRVRSAVLNATDGTITSRDALVIRVADAEEKLPPGMLDLDVMKKYLEESDSYASLRRRGSIGGRFTTKTKQALADYYGGTPESEVAVMTGLAWLAKTQQPDGSWSLLEAATEEGSSGSGGSGSEKATPDENLTAATAFALLPFLAEGVTHKYAPQGQPELAGYKEVVQKGLIFLASRQTRTSNVNDGNLGGGTYAHAIGTIALCEAYGLSGDDRTRFNAQLALKYLLQSQHRAGGGWRYGPNQAGDMSVTAWVFLGIRSAQLTGIPVLPAVLERASRFVDSCAAGPSEVVNSRYAYTPGTESKLSLSAAGLLTRQYLGWEKDTKDLVTGCAYLMENKPPTSATSLGNIYYYYYATQVLHHMEGTDFDLWNHLVREHVLRTQEKDGPNAGSWSPKGVDWGDKGGRMYATALAMLTLQAPYRHLPMFRQFKLY